MEGGLEKKKAPDRVARGLAAMLAMGSPVIGAEQANAFPQQDNQTVSYNERGTTVDLAHREVIRQHAVVNAISFVRDIGKGTAKMKPGEQLSREMRDDIGAAINDYLATYSSISELQKAVFVEGENMLNPVVLKYLTENLAFIQEKLQNNAAVEGE